jgi:hypothetical protein
MGGSKMKIFSYISGLIVATVSITSQALPLIPMVQVFQTEKNGSISEQFLISNDSFSAFVTGANSCDIILTLPNGTSINESNASNYGINWSIDTSDINNEYLITIGSDSAITGTFAFTVKARDQEKAGFSVLEEPSLQYRAIIGNPSQPITPNTEIPFSVILYYAGFPATGATINVGVLDSMGTTVRQLTLKDDGQTPDLSAGDGVYTTLTNLDKTGDYKTVINANWNNHRGRVYEAFSVSEKDVSVSGQFNVKLVDSDNNGLINNVVLTFEELQPRLPGTYSVTAEIKDASGTSVTETALVNQPETPLSVTFDVKKLKTLSAQPWHVSSLNIWKGPKVLGVWNDLGELNIDISHFERDPLIVKDIVGDRGIDSDADGLFDKLEIDVSIDTLVSGNYGISADLRSTSDNTLIGSTGISQLSLNAGINTVKLQFMGSNIGGSGKDGPYKLTNFLIYPNFNTSAQLAQLVALVGETSAYSCSQFIGCNSSMENEVIRIANGLCEKQGYQLLAKLKLIQAIANKHPDVAEKQLEGLYQRAKAIERSGSCPPAEGWSGDK